MDVVFNMEEKETQKTKTAVALSYELGDQAPKVVASGRGYLADKLLEKAKESHVPLHQDSKLAGTLSKLEIGECIPPQLYDVVAEVLVFGDRADKTKEKQNGKK